MTNLQVISLGAIAALLVLSAFFSGSETALTAASRSRIHHLELKGNQRAKLAGKLIANRERLIGTILLGNNAVNIFASALATSVLIALAGEAGIVYATIGMTLLVLIFAEILPKTYAIRHADRTALAVAPILRALVILLSPIMIAIQMVVGGMLRLFGGDYAVRVGRDQAEEELRGTISLHAREGTVVKQERDMLRGILDLRDVEVNAIMTHRKSMETVDASAPPEQIVERVLESRHSRFPIWRDQPDNIVGVVHANDLLSAVYTHRDDLGKLNIMEISNEPWFVPETTTLSAQLHAFRERQAHFALVVDEYGDLMGFVTLEDVLEEIVGEIEDEFDIALRGIYPQADGSFIVPGATTIRDLNRELDWSLPDEEAATIAGLVIHEAQQIPQVGQTFRFHGFRFRVERRLRNQITLLSITPPAAAGEKPTEAR